MLALLLAVGSTPGAAQTPGGLTTTFAMATEAAVRAVTLRVYPVAEYAGRDESGVPRYLRRPFSAEERRLLREHFGIEGDWPHVELSGPLGYRSIEALLLAAQTAEQAGR